MQRSECRFARAASRRLTFRQNASGMALFEVLLVLILLVVMGSLAKPALEGTLASFRLKRAVDQVLSDWSKVRTKAIEDGQVYQFRFSKDSNEYRVDPWYADESYQPRESDLEESESSASEIFADSSDSESEESEDEIGWLFKSEVAETIVFDSGEQAVVQPPEEREVETLEREDSAEWSAPILFFPDGTTSEASVLLRNENEIYQRATLRALTGSARGSELLSSEEIDEQESR